MAELRKNFCEKSPSLLPIIPLQKNFHAGKGVLKWLSSEKISVKTSVPNISEIYSRADKWGAKRNELRKIL